MSRSVARKHAVYGDAAAKGSAQASAVQENSTADISVILIEPNSLLRDGVRGLFGSTNFHVVASCASFEMISLSASSSPDLVLIGGDDLEWTRNVLKCCSERYPDAKRAVLNDWHEMSPIALFEAGAHACLRNDVTVEILLTALSLVVMGANIICSASKSVGNEKMGRSVHEERHVDKAIVDGLVSDKIVHRLSNREIAILECLVHGDSNKIISRKFQIAEATVKVHIKAILRKIGAANRTQAAIWAMTNCTERAIG